MGIFKGRYGMTGDEVSNLYQRWLYIREDCDGFPSFDAFCLWASESSHEKGDKLCKRDGSKPHSPDNSYWISKKERAQEYTSHFCVGCTRKCPDRGLGCVPWKRWFVENWNKNIYQGARKPEVPAPLENSRYFCYEHPDLVEEV